MDQMTHGKLVFKDKNMNVSYIIYTMNRILCSLVSHRAEIMVLYSSA